MPAISRNSQYTLGVISACSAAVGLAKVLTKKAEKRKDISEKIDVRR